MREFNFNIPKTGLKNTNTATGGLLQLKNLKPEDGYWSVPKALDMTLGEGQLLRGRGVTLLWKEGEEGEEPELPELPEGAIGISTIEQLQLIGNDVDYPLDGYYVLTQDIDASATVTWNDGAGFAPIGGSYWTPFIGTLDGQGYGVTDLFIDRPSEFFVGLVGYNVGGTVTNCYATGAVAGNTEVGGLVGYNDGTVTNCYATGAVTGNVFVGGLVGDLGDGTVTASYYDTQTTGQADNTGKGAPRTTAAMYQQATFTGWDFGVVWTIIEDTDYPRLEWESAGT